MKQSLIAQAQKLLPIALMTGLLLVLSLVLGNMAQDLSPSYLMLMIGVLVAWVVYSIFAGINLHGSLILVALAFIKPLWPVIIMLLLLFVVLTLTELYQKDRLSLLVPYPLALSLLLGFGIYGALRVQDPESYKFFATTVIVPIVVLMLCRNARITERSFLIWMKAIVAVAAFVGAYGVVIAIQNPFERLGSFWFTAMTINGFYTLGFFFAVTLILHSEQPLGKLIYGLGAALILFGMLYTYTRMAILAVVFGLFLFMIRVRRMRYLGIVFLGLLPLIIPSSMMSRIELGITSDLSMIIRGIAWYMASLQILQNPLTGIGFGVWEVWYPVVIPVEKLYAGHPHNLFLNVMVQIGIIGGLAYLYMIYDVLRRYWKTKIKGRQGIFHYGVWVSLISVVFACVTDIFIQQHMVSILFWLSLGMVMTITNESKIHD